MKYSIFLSLLLSTSALMAVETIRDGNTQVMSEPTQKVIVDSPSVACPETEQLLTEEKNIRISVTGQGVAPMNTTSPAQAYALAKRAAIADAYRMIAEKVKGVRVEGQDSIQNMMVKRSSISTSVNAMVRNANVVETTFKEGLCEVEMEITLSHSQFAR
ncbi:LPP20 family lipoprotein [bacterium]|nr:LPP20 family lipoprotein [bacterium]MBU1994838.1 LPP20 family lipoprotein [bacterium]